MLHATRLSQDEDFVRQAWFHFMGVGPSFIIYVYLFIYFPSYMLLGFLNNTYSLRYGEVKTANA